jgi:hypothetical protein
MASKEIGQRRGVPSLVAVLLAAGLVAFVFVLSGNSACPPQQQAHIHPEGATAGDGQQQRRRTGGQAGQQQLKQPEWGPRRASGSSKRGDKYMVTSVMGLDPERLNIFVRSLRRYSPATHLVVFVEQNTSHALLEANDAEVIPFKMEEGSALVLHRWASSGNCRLPQLLVRREELGVVLCCRLATLNCAHHFHSSAPACCLFKRHQPSWYCATQQSPTLHHAHNGSSRMRAVPPTANRPLPPRVPSTHLPLHC